jgi:adenylate kinase
MIIAVTGTPGTGKTAVGRALAGKLGWRFIELNTLAREKKLYCGYDRARKTRIVDTEKIKNEVRKLAVKEKNLVVESHYAHDIPNDLTVVLRCGIKDLRKRLSRKGWGRRKTEENIEAEIMEICKSEALEMGRRILEADTAGKRPEEVAGEILKRIKI